MRKEKLVSDSLRLREHLVELGGSLLSPLRKLDSKNRDSMTYLIGIKSLGRSGLIGAPSVAPSFNFADKDPLKWNQSPVLVHFVTNAVFKTKYGRRELKTFRDGDPSTFPFIQTVTLDDPEEAIPILRTAEECVSDLKQVYSEFRNYILSNLTIEDLIA